MNFNGLKMTCTISIVENLIYINDPGFTPLTLRSVIYIDSVVNLELLEVWLFVLEDFPLLENSARDFRGQDPLIIFLRETGIRNLDVNLWRVFLLNNTIVLMVLEIDNDCVKPLIAGILAINLLVQVPLGHSPDFILVIRFHLTLYSKTNTNINYYNK